MFRFFSRYWSAPATLCFLAEAGLLLGAVWAAYRIRFWHETASIFFYSDFPIRAGVFVFVVIVNLYLNDLYDFSHHLEPRELIAKLLRALTFSAIALLVIYYVTYPALTTGRGVFAISMALAALLLSAWRSALRFLLKKRFWSERLLIVGTDGSARELAREVLERDHLGYRVVGFIGDDPKLQGVSLVNPRVVGTTDQVWVLAQAYRATRVVVAQRDTRGKLDMESLLRCKTSGIPVEEGSRYYEQLTGKIMVEGLRMSSLIFSRGFVVSPSVLFAKRLLDTAVASVGLILATPVMLLTALAIRLDSRGPVLFRQTRVGRGGERFTLWKFRSMRADAEAQGARWASRGDPRITRVGRFIRRTRIDELPQLWNVLIGDMSLVGPRPERPRFVEQLKKKCPFYEQRLVVRPGLTGWAQIRSPYAASMDESIDKLQYDLFYIKNLSIFLDLSILASTAKIVLLGRGAR